MVGEGGEWQGRVVRGRGPGIQGLQEDHWKDSLDRQMDGMKEDLGGSGPGGSHNGVGERAGGREGGWGKEDQWGVDGKVGGIRRASGGWAGRLKTTLVIFS